MTIAAKSASVRFDNVVRRYGPIVAVDHISFDIEAGTLATLLGPSGCGKTTTLRMIAGLELPSDGTITIGDRDVTRMSATDRDVTMVFQSYALFPHMTVLENVCYGLSVAGLPKAVMLDKAAEGLRLVGLSGYEARMPSELSGGQQQRVAVARALVLEPQVLLFDEPLSNLDAKLRRHMREEIRDLQQGLGLTSVYVTHDQEEALAVSDRIIVMKSGVIAQAGTPEDLYERPETEFVADFIGGSNVVDGAIRSVEGGVATVAIGSLLPRLPARGHREGPVGVAIRPDSILLHALPQAAGSLPGEVAKATYLGGHIEYSVTSEVGELFVIDRQVGQAMARGTNVHLTLADRGVCLVSRG